MCVNALRCVVCVSSAVTLLAHEMKCNLFFANTIRKAVGVMLDTTRNAQYSGTWSAVTDIDTDTDTDTDTDGIRYAMHLVCCQSLLWVL